MASTSPHFKTVGQKYGDFEVTKISDISELQCKLVELVHIPSGAKVLSINNEDPENLFSLSFQTIPKTSNGVAHILEHTVLCGSKKFPVKDPFFAMQRRSLNTFMNALTGADFTCYPAASQVPKDLYNLLEVYLDAVFYPKLEELSFLQEGHRLEFSDPLDHESPLEYKGIVFNEMKGALNNPNSLLSEAMSRALFPDITYGINSGGDPKVIPTLTYQQLLDFHREYYHPSRCLFFFYGNLPLEGHLDFIETHVLHEVKAMEPIPPLPLQPRFAEPKRLIVEYPVAADEELRHKTLISFGWLTCQILEQKELLALSILEIILLDTDASPLKMALLKSGLCKQVSCYMEDEISEVPLIITMRGCDPENADPLEKLIKETLQGVIKEGISLDLFENAMHQLEFYRSEITGDGSPFGLSLFMRSALLKQHGGDPTSGLHIHTLFDEIRALNLSNPNYLTGLIVKYFLENHHMVRISMVPSKELANQEFMEEKRELEAIKEKLTSEQKKKLIAQAQELIVFQKKQESADLDILPKVSIDDIPKFSRTYKLEEEKIGKINVFYHQCFTNEITYVDLVFNLPELPEKDLPYARMLTTLIGQLGCGGRSYEQNLEYIQANTGGVGAFLSMNTQAQDYHHFFPSLVIRGKALDRKSSQFFKLMEELSSSIDFTNIERLKEIIMKQYTALESSINQNALKYALNLGSAGLDLHSKIINDLYGLEYFWMIKRLAENFDAEADELIHKLETLYSQILSENTPELVITCDSAMYDKLKGHRFYGLHSLGNTPFPLWQPNYEVDPVHSQGRIITSPVAFNAKILKTISYMHLDSPALSIAAFLCDNLTLHTALREQGGAYGGGAVSSAMAGSFYFYSYRDPNIASTFKSFKASIQTILDNDFEEADIEEAKIEMIQALDAPVAPGSRGSVAYNWIREGKSLEIRQSFRNRLLHLTRTDVIAAVKKWIVPHLDDAIEISFAGIELLNKENEKLHVQGKKQLPIEKI